MGFSMPVEQGFRTNEDELCREPRFEVRLTACLRTDAGTASLRLLELSRGGAPAEMHCPPAPGTRATLSRERMAVEGQVIWVRGARFGLAFDEPLRATELFFQLGRSRAAAREAPAERRALIRTSAESR
jgi:hypothetical protein